MPVLVTKKLMSADCAWAGWAARTANAAAAGMKHTREMILARAGIVSSACHWSTGSLMSQLGLNSTRPGRSYSRRRDPEKTRCRKEKAPRNPPRRLESLPYPRRSGLLDRRELPIGTPPPHEGPYLRRLGRRFAARDQPAGGAVEGLVDEREPHRDAGVVGIALAPGFREVTLQELDAGNLVDGVAGLVLGEIPGEVRHHLRRR